MAFWLNCGGWSSARDDIALCVHPTGNSNASYTGLLLVLAPRR
jgi:hypothetical protein